MIFKIRKLLLPTAWLLTLWALLQLGAAFRSKSEHFFGIVDDQEQAVSFQYPVEVVELTELLGKQVKQGTPLLKVKRQELDSHQAVLNEQIRHYQLKKQEANNSLSSQLTNLQAQKKATLADIDYQIHNLELKLNQNRALLRSISGEIYTPMPNAPELIELTDLKTKRRYAAQAIQAQIDNLTSQVQASSHPIDAQIAELQHNKTALQRQDRALSVTAQFDGQIVAVNAKVGELVAAFSPILSLHRLKPTTVTGYIHESIFSNVTLGQTVWLQSVNPEHNQETLTGTVESLGNRIVEYPTRLQINPTVSAWGRQVVIRLGENSKLLFGEKVQIFLNPQTEPFLWIQWRSVGKWFN